VKTKKKSLKYYFEELRQHLHIPLLKDLDALTLFLNKSPLNNAIFINLQHIMGDMRSVILVYIAMYTDAYISKSIKAKECILRIQTYLPVIHYYHRPSNLKQTHCVKENGKSRYQIEAEHMAIHMQYTHVRS
jgi:hypothetical protein